jgi:preprotein translocase subunit SecE
MQVANKLAPEKNRTVPERSLPQRLSPLRFFGQKSTAPQKAGQKPTATARSSNRVVRWVRDMRAEIKKITWPTREAATNLTILVIVVSVAVGIMLGVVDFAFSSLFEFLISAM